MKLIATGFLVGRRHRLPDRQGQRRPRHRWVGYVRAGAEAAMIGALADWFAVTALFKHPLGLPIPHTAIIPKRKDQTRSQPRRVRRGELPHHRGADRPHPRCPGRTSARDVAGGPGPRPPGRQRRRRHAAGLDRGHRRSRHPGRTRRRRRTPAARDRGGTAGGQGDRRRRRRWPSPEAARQRADRARLVPRREPGHFPSAAGPRVAVVGAGVDRRPHLRQDLRRRSPVPRRHRQRPRP